MTSDVDQVEILNILLKKMKVDAIDGSIELCKIAQKYIGINVKHMLFQQLNVRHSRHFRSVKAWHKSTCAG